MNGFTDLQRAHFRLAEYDLQLHRLRRAAQSVLGSQRPLSTHQSAVPTNTLDELRKAAHEEAPGIDYRQQEIVK